MSVKNNTHIPANIKFLPSEELRQVRHDCVKCRQPLLPPIEQLKCGHRICNICEIDILQNKKITKCPGGTKNCDNVNLTNPDDRYIDRAVTNRLWKCKCSCTFMKWGCNEEIELKSLDFHSRSCIWKPVYCKNKELGCFAKVPEPLMQDHLSECRHELSYCNVCLKCIKIDHTCISSLRCVLQNCDFIGPKEMVIHHVITKHGIDNLIDGYIETKMHYNNNKHILQAHQEQNELLKSLNKKLDVEKEVYKSFNGQFDSIKRCCESAREDIDKFNKLLEVKPDILSNDLSLTRLTHKLTKTKSCDKNNYFIVPVKLIDFKNEEKFVKLKEFAFDMSNDVYIDSDPYYVPADGYRMFLHMRMLVKDGTYRIYVHPALYEGNYDDTIGEDCWPFRHDVTLSLLSLSAEVPHETKTFTTTISRPEKGNLDEIGRSYYFGDSMCIKQSMLENVSFLDDGKFFIKACVDFTMNKYEAAEPFPDKDIDGPAY